MALTSSQGSKNNTLVMVGVLLLVIGIGGTYEFLAPNLKAEHASLAEVTAELNGTQTDIDSLTKAKSELDTDKAALSTQKGVDFTKVANVYPKTEDIPGLYLQLEGLMGTVAGFGVTNAAYQVGAPVLDATISAVTIPVTVSGAGSYAAAKAMVTQLETNLRPFSITTLNLSQTLDKDKGTPTGLFTITAAAVVRAETLSAAYSSPTQ